MYVMELEEYAMEATRSLTVDMEAAMAMLG